MSYWVRYSCLLLVLLLGACARVPSVPPSSPTSPPLPASAVVTSAAIPTRATPAPVASVNVWDRLRASFDMPGCDADPAVLAWASRYTRHPQQFEKQLQSVMPRLVYVQQVAEQYDVAGEFVLLPWVESHFRPVGAGAQRRSAGMWQIMPVTAGAMGLRINDHYDGRLDVPAATHAVMKLLEQYHKQFGDWRVVDYAYNAGEFAIRRVIRKHGMPSSQPTIPEWPLHKVTRDHLTKLLAIACVVREPDRFQVSLPSLPGDQRLVREQLTRPMSFERAARHADMSVEVLKRLNSAHHGDVIQPRNTAYLLLPAKHAQQFREALPEDDHNPLAGATNTDVVTDAPRTTRKTHTVRAGDSLWQIARDNKTKVSLLQRWNGLDGGVLKPGQVLVVTPE